MEAHRGRINAVMVGVGAAFDYHAGTLKRAPQWMQGSGLEWFYRLAHEPRRLWKRYLVTNTRFLFNASLQLAGQAQPSGKVGAFARWNDLAKRLQDVSVASLALSLISPLLVGVALAIKLESSGPVLLRQKRWSFNGQTFMLWKFRSTYRADIELDFEIPRGLDGSGITRVGRFIRQTGIEKLPQLINVLQGSMSIVGPNPQRRQTTSDAKMLADDISDYAARQRVKPGITGWAQVHGLDLDLMSIGQLMQRAQYDREYIQRRSLLLDARIILMTLVRLTDRRIA